MIRAGQDATAGAAPAVSVIVPFFNSESTLADCVESLLAQETEAPFEILLVDNASSDRSAEIARGFEGVRVLYESVPGAYAARNVGIREAQAPIIALTDADCVADPNWIEAILEAMQEPDIGMLIGHCRYPAEASRMLRFLGSYENVKARYVVERCPPAYHFAYANNMAVRAELFTELGPFLEWKRAGDSELVHRMALRRPDLRLAFCDQMRVEHLEFIRGRARAERLSLYTQTNSRIVTFRELSLRHHLAVLTRLVRGGDGR